jgi:hypothetical protein
MKYFLTTIFCFVLCRVAGQKVEFFTNINFDSSYCLVGTNDYLNDKNDTIGRIGFLIDKVEDLLKLKKEWIFRKKVPRLNIENNSITIYTIQAKRTVQKVALIYPKQGIISCNNGWYYFDLKKYIDLFNKHRIIYRSAFRSFSKYSDYAAYGNSILNDSTLLFFLEPDDRFEGKFTLTGNRTNDPADPFFVLSNINQELLTMAGKDSFECGLIQNDSLNERSRDKVKITIKCSKSLYEKYKNERYKKSEWTPLSLDIKLFWKE